MRKAIPAAYQHYLTHRGPEPAPGEGAGVTPRAVLVGALLSLLIATAVPYTNMIMKGSLLAHNFNTPAALFLFFLFVGVVNVALGRLRRSLAFGPAELATIYIMAMIATTIPTIGFSEYLLPILAGLYYYATPENEWAELMHPHVPGWIAPRDPDAMKHFYEGLPSGQPIPWGAWFQPLLYWCLFIVAVYFAMMCAMVILRRQWLEQERLVYPLVQVPLEMIQDDERLSLIKPFFRNRVMWIGFAIPFALGMVNAIHVYFPSFPGFTRFAGQGFMGTTFMLFRNSTALIVVFNLGLVGFSYLLNRDVALGFWFFFLLSTVQRGMFNLLGVHSPEKLSRFANACGPYLAHQAMGAMIVLVLSGLWAARKPLGQVFGKAIGMDPDVDDAGEVLSFRAAVWGLVGATAFVSVWLWRSGLPWWIVPMFLFAAFVVFMTLTRAVAEGGVAVIRTPITPADFVISGLGSSALGPSGLTALAFTHVWAANIRIFFMPCFANALKLAEEIRGSKRALAWAVGLAVILALAGSIWSILTLSYKYGGVNLHGFWFIGVPKIAFTSIAPLFAHPVSASLGGWLFTGIGAILMGLLTLARHRLFWWPVHPLGFATGTFNIMGYVWFSIFVAWLLKSIILKYGGASLYRKTRPFFLGLIMGQIFIAGMWLVIDFFTGKIGNAPIEVSML